MKICDLHTHSIYSDGTYSPSEIIDSAIDIGLSAVALCDHNTIDGLFEFLAAAEGKNIEAIAGAEFSVDYMSKEIHLLGLFIPQNQFARISDLMNDVQEQKAQSNINLIESLNRAGYEIDFEQLKNSTPNGNFNRAHVAAELTQKGYTESIQQAFETVLSLKSGYYKEPPRPSLFDMIEFIKSINAVSVLAHPFLNLTQEELEVLLPQAKAKGLAGMECYYSLYDEETIKKSLDLIERHQLKLSGGSDFHGEKKPDIKLGVGKDNLKIPYSCVEHLKNSSL